MTHLTPDELIDAMEGMLPVERQAHLAACDECRQQLAELSSVLSEAKQTSVPEPSPLFWPHFSERVRVAVDQESASGGNRPSWLRWQTLAPIGALALVVLALAFNSGRRSGVSDDIAGKASMDVALSEDGWSAVAQLVGDIDVETASAAGVIEPGVAERAVVELSAEEQQELTRLLKTELMRAKS